MTGRVAGRKQSFASDNVKVARGTCVHKLSRSGHVAVRRLRNNGNTTLLLLPTPHCCSESAFLNHFGKPRRVRACCRFVLSMTTDAWTKRAHQSCWPSRLQVLPDLMAA